MSDIPSENKSPTIEELIMLLEVNVIWVKFGEIEGEQVNGWFSCWRR